MPKIHGRLGAVAPAANTNTSLYQVPANSKATVKVFLCNRAATEAAFRLALVDGAIGAASDEDYLFYDSIIPANGSVIEDRITVSAGHSLLVRFNSANCSAVAVGVQEDM